MGMRFAQDLDADPQHGVPTMRHPLCHSRCVARIRQGMLGSAGDEPGVSRTRWGRGALLGTFDKRAFG